MLKRLLFLAALALLPTPAFAARPRAVVNPSQTHAHCGGRQIIVVGVPVRTRYRRPVTYSQPYIVPYYAPFYGNTYRGNGAAYNPKPAEPLMIENPYVK